MSSLSKTDERGFPVMVQKRNIYQQTYLSTGLQLQDIMPSFLWKVVHKYKYMCIDKYFKLKPIKIITQNSTHET